MKSIIYLEYILNLIFLLIFYMHMFQLNSYKYIKNINWIKNNLKVILIKCFFIVLCTILIFLKSNILNLICILILVISIIYNLPKKKQKIPLDITNRVKRMFITQILLILIFSTIGGIKNYIIIKLQILNLLSFTLCMISNLINTPIEYLLKRKYINQAKKIINDMPNLIVIGVTGSYGKTSVKNFLNTLLSKKYEVLVTPKNYNTTMGVVKTIRENLKPTHQIFICEMGATKKGDIEAICNIVKPKIGIITAIGPQHLETFKTIDNIIHTKFELYDSVKKSDGQVFLNYNNQYLSQMEKKKNIFYYGINNNELDYNSYQIKSSCEGLKFTMSDDKSKEEVNFETELIGKHNVINLTGAIGIADILGISLSESKTRIKKIKNVEHRLQLVSKGEVTIIDDAYNSNPISSKSALDTLSEFEGTKIIITPGLVELGDKQRKYNFEFGQYITNVCDYIYLVGQKNSKPILEGIKSKENNKDKTFVVDSPEEAMQEIKKLDIKGKVAILLENDLPDNYNL